MHYCRYRTSKRHRGSNVGDRVRVNLLCTDAEKGFDFACVQEVPRRTSEGSIINPFDRLAVPTTPRARGDMIGGAAARPGTIEPLGARYASLPRRDEPSSRADSKAGGSNENTLINISRDGGGSRAHCRRLVGCARAGHDTGANQYIRVEADAEGDGIHTHS